MLLTTRPPMAATALCSSATHAVVPGAGLGWLSVLVRIMLLKAVRAVLLSAPCLCPAFIQNIDSIFLSFIAAAQPVKNLLVPLEELIRLMRCFLLLAMVR